MRIKRYEGQFVHDVIAQIREELGSEAVVLHTRWRSPAGLRRLVSRPKVEVWAGVESGHSAAVSSAPEPAIEPAPQPAPEPAPAPEPESEPAPAESYAARALVLRQAIENRMAQHRNGTAVKPPPEEDTVANHRRPKPRLDVLDDERSAAPIEPQPEERPTGYDNGAGSPDDLTVALFREFNAAIERIEGKVDALVRAQAAEEGDPPRLSALLDSGVVRDIAVEVAEAAEGRTVAETLLEAFQCTGELNLDDGPKVVALVGPSGVGKTTLTAKLAGHYGVLGGARVLLCSTDTRRVGTFEQLRALGELMQLPTCPIYSMSEAATRIEIARRNHDLVIVDTAASFPADGHDWDELVNTLVGIEPDEIHLVVSASMRSHDVNLAVEGFQEALPLHGVAVTKLDESHRPGVLAELAWRRLVPISYLSAGANIPGDFEVAGPERLLDLVWSMQLDPGATTHA